MTKKIWNRKVLKQGKPGRRDHESDPLEVVPGRPVYIPQGNKGIYKYEEINSLSQAAISAISD